MILALIFTKEDSYGHAVNEYEDAMDILKEVMNSEAYKRLKIQQFSKRVTCQQPFFIINL